MNDQKNKNMAADELVTLIIVCILAVIIFSLYPYGE